MSKKNEAIIFEKVYAISHTALMINRAHSDIPRNVTWLLHFGILQCLFTAVFSVVIYNIYLSISYADYSEACRHASISVVYCVVTFKYIILIFKQKTNARIINMMKADFNKVMPEDAREIVYEYAMRGKKVCIQWLIICICFTMSLIGKHVFLELYTYVIDDWKLYPLYPLIYPRLIEEYKDQPVVYTALYLSLLYYDIYGSLMYLGFVPLGPIFMLHACGQLEIVKRRILALYKNDDSTEDVERKLKHIVRHMQYIYDYVECIKDVHKVVYEFTLKSTTFILPIALYELLECLKLGEISVECTGLFIGAIFLVSTPCYYSDQLMAKGEEVRLAIYSCGWETRCDHAVRKILLVALIRTSKPIVVRTHFCTICLDELANIFHQAYALFNLMNAAWG